jgi:hypothetical protein
MAATSVSPLPPSPDSCRCKDCEDNMVEEEKEAEEDDKEALVVPDQLSSLVLRACCQVWERGQAGQTRREGGAQENRQTLTENGPIAATHRMVTLGQTNIETNKQWQLIKPCKIKPPTAH